MFSIKEMVLSVENELILLNLFEWESRLCLISSNIQSEVGKKCSTIGCSADSYTNGSYS